MSPAEWSHEWSHEWSRFMTTIRDTLILVKVLRLFIFLNSASIPLLLCKVHRGTLLPLMLKFLLLKRKVLLRLHRSHELVMLVPRDGIAVQEIVDPSQVRLTVLVLQRVGLLCALRGRVRGGDRRRADLANELVIVLPVHHHSMVAEVSDI